MKKEKSFTLIELIVVVVILGILATLVIPAYLNYVEESKAKVCDTNLKTLHAALEIFVLDHGAVPATLSQIPQDTLNRGYAKVMQNNKSKWKTELAYFVVGLADRNYAYAAGVQISLLRIAKGNKNILICPADDRKDIAPENKISYAMNAGIRGLNREQLDNFVGEVIFDYPASTSSAVVVLPPTIPDIMKRHKKHGLHPIKYAQGIVWKGTSIAKDCLTCKHNCCLTYEKSYSACQSFTNPTLRYGCIQSARHNLAKDRNICCWNFGSCYNEHCNNE